MQEKETTYRAFLLGRHGKYDFDNFYEDVTEKRDLETQEELLKILNLLLDEGILCFPKKGEENDI